MNWTLDVDASYTCPVKVRHAFTPGLEPPSTDPPALPHYALTAQATARYLIHDFVGARRSGLLVDLRHVAAEQSSSDLCLRAMNEGVPVIVGPALPPDLHGHRRGRAAVLVRGPDTEAGRPGYYPVQVHGRRVLDLRPAAAVRVSSFGAPRPERSSLNGWDFRSSRVRDRLELAHLWHLLVAAGHAAGGRPVGGLIGTDRRGIISWAPLDEPSVPESPRTSDGSGLTTVLQRYATEFEFRLAAARAAQDEASTQIEPIHTRECETCRWWPVCLPLLSEDDLSLRIAKWPLDVHEITALRSLGIATVADLAAADLDTLIPSYGVQVAHRQGINQRLFAAARRARMLQAGVELEQTTKGPIPVPAASLEIDLDIEAAADSRVYLWGFLIHDRAAQATPYYKAFSAFEHLTAAAEADLAVEALTWLSDVVGGSNALVYHYSDYEVVRLSQISAADSRLAWTIDFAHKRFVDLFHIVRDHFFGVHGLGLKNVAHMGAGFDWRDPDPGGLNSQTWFEEAVSGPVEARSAARERVLEYNEDDVRATWELRRWLRSLG